MPSPDLLRQVYTHAFSNRIAPHFIKKGKGCIDGRKKDKFIHTVPGASLAYPAMGIVAMKDLPQVRG